MASYYPPEMLTLDESMAVDSDPEVDELASDAAGNVDDGASVKEELVLPSRLPGQSFLPMLRIENMIQADGTMGILTMSKEALYVISLATEEFIKRLARGGLEQARSEDRSDIQYEDMAATTLQYQEFRFLEDFIPTPIPLDLALQERENVEAKALEEDPAPVPAPVRPPPHVAGPTTSSTSKFRVNGNTKTKNGVKSANGAQKSRSNSATAPPVASSSRSASTVNYTYPNSDDSSRLEALKQYLNERLPDLPEVTPTPELLQALAQKGIQIPPLGSTSQAPSITSTEPTTGALGTPAETPAETPLYTRDPSATSSVRDQSEAIEDVKLGSGAPSATSSNLPSRGGSITIDSLITKGENT